MPGTVSILTSRDDTTSRLAPWPLLISSSASSRTSRVVARGRIGGTEGACASQSDLNQAHDTIISLARSLLRTFQSSLAIGVISVSYYDVPVQYTMVRGPGGAQSTHTSLKSTWRCFDAYALRAHQLGVLNPTLSNPYKYNWLCFVGP